MKIKLFLVFLILHLFVTGCWNRVELDRRAIVAGFGADKAEEEGKIQVTVQVVDAGEIKAIPLARGGSMMNAVTVYTGTGFTAFDAFRNLSMVVGEKLFLSEVRVLVIGEELAREGLDKVIDFYERDHEPNIRDYLIVVKGGEAKEVLETELRINKIWAYGIDSMVKTTMAHSKAPATEIIDFLKAVESKTTAPVATVIHVLRKGNEENAGEGKSNQDGTTAVQPKELKVSETAVFRHYKLTGWLDEKESRGLLWVTGKVKSGIIVVSSPEKEDKLAAIEIIRAKSKIKPEITDGNLIINIDVWEEGNLGEEQPDTMDVSKPIVLKELEEQKKTVIEDEISAAVIKAQELNADIFGFGEAVRRKYPREWKQLEDQWDEIFPTLEVNIAVDAKIRRTGKITKSAEPKP
ncbi:Ger(x)C family spore germination protein [Pelotomaculum terephthalicicum JT]|uniref:Ger(x)C family spore germination protein n=1 Tax=Pelotomaculum TaxID=191373 RepID=UPI0009C88615|nr:MULTISPECIES: Ger(x)C family spore germination protein [Pelotomaculum]MCG9968638.1 Ger(x)C family spore germination protein [Pelotomaculum terephthalicicum JT]OPX85262.1 MAG: Spore germination protein A3 precursor [Pelotomaculum sp. PtaB.Bin117]OPY62585.1 MAG: Spore germination protein A3 precursor [Pelotomaculum sp. PtaU1.Bin065]